MITSKQRAYLRGLANNVQALYQIGKQGATEQVVEQLDKALEAREIIKVHVLENSLLNTKQICSELSEKLGAEPVQAIGSKLVLYRESKTNKEIYIPPEKKPVKKETAKKNVKKSADKKTDKTSDKKFKPYYGNSYNKTNKNAKKAER